MAIELLNLGKTYGTTAAVDDLSMRFEDHTLTVLIGPSGCGKTTTMKMINRLIERTSGNIRFDGRSIDSIDRIELRRSIGYVIQEIGLFPHMTVFENIAVVPRLLRWKSGRIENRVSELLEMVNLDPGESRDKYPSQLSGGQRQRVGVARGLAADPAILLMDEPFGAIDPINRERLQDSFLEIQKSIRKTVVFVTHDIREAVKLGDRIAILDRGRLVQYDETIKVIHDPANAFVENLLGSDRALKGLELIRVRDAYEPGTPVIDLDRTRTAGQALREVDRCGGGYAYVVDGRSCLRGYVLTRDLTRVPADSPLLPHIRTTETTRLMSTLMDAITLMVTTGMTSIPVVDERGGMLGMLRFRDIFTRFEEISSSLRDSG